MRERKEGRQEGTVDISSCAKCDPIEPLLLIPDLGFRPCSGEALREALVLNEERETTLPVCRGGEGWKVGR